MLICCRVKVGSSPEQSLVFEGSSVIIGSSGDVRVPGAKPLHASIEQREGQYFVVDKSGGDTLCNGQRIEKEKQIRPGDKIAVQDAEIVFLLTDKQAEVTAVPQEATPQKATSQGAQPPEVQPPSLPDAGDEGTQTQGTSPKGPVTLGPASLGPAPLGPAMGLSDIQAQRKSAAVLPPEPASTLKATPAKPVATPQEATPLVAAPDKVTPDKATPPVATPDKAAPVKKTSQKGWFGSFAPPSESAYRAQPASGNAVEVSVVWGERLVMLRHFKQACDVYVGSDPSNDLVLPLGVGVKKHKLFHKAAGGSVAVSLPSGMSDGEVVNKSGARALASLNYAAGTSVSLNQGEMLRLNLHDGVQLVVRYTDEAPNVVAVASSEFAMRETAGFLLAAMVAIVFSLYMSLYTSYTFEEEKLEERERKATIVFKPVQKAQKIKKKTVTRVRTVKDPGKGQVKKAKTATKKVKATAAKKTAKKSGASAKSKPKPSLESAGLLSAFGGGGVSNDLSKGFDGTGELLGDAQKATGRSGMGADRAGVKMGLQTARGKRDTVGAAAVRTGGKGSGAFGSGVGGLGARGKMDLNLDVDDIETSSSIDREAIRRVVRRNVPAIRACYNQELNRNKNLRGKVVVEWDIANAGRVVGTRLKSNSMPTRRVADCIRRLIATLTFPAPGANEVARVAFPFVFSSR